MTTIIKLLDWLDRLNRRWLMGALIALSLLIKIGIWVQSPVITADGPVYIAQAEEFLRGNWQHGLALNGNLFIYPLLIAGLGYIGVDLFVAGRLLSLCFSVSTIIPLFLLTSCLFNRRVAFWASLAFAVAPSLNEYSVYVMRDPGFLCMFAWAVYFAVRAIDEERFRFFLFSLGFSFLSFLFRVEGFFFPFFLVVFILGDAIGRRAWLSPFFKKVVVLLILLTLGAAVSGWVFSEKLLRFNRLGNVIQMSKMPFDKGVFSYHPQVEAELRKMEAVIPQGQVDNDFAEIARENIRFIYFVGLMANVKKVLYPAFFFAALIGLIAFRGYRSSQRLFLWLIGSYLLILFLYLLHRSFLETRYVYAPVFLLLPWVGYGIERFLGWLNQKQCLPRVVPPLLIALLFAIPGVESATEVKRQFLSAKQAGEWLAAHPEINVGAIISNRREITFYAKRGLDLIFPRSIDPDYLAPLAKQRNVELISILRERDEEPVDLSIENFVLLEKFTDRRYETFIFRKQDESSGN